MMRLILGLVVMFAVLARDVLSQGGLAPPGAPAPTMKTLDQVEARTPITNVPYTIHSSGSYYLTGNLANTVPSTNGITIVASDVTIDLNGFTLTGAQVGTEVGILQRSGSRVSVYNGSVTLFTGGGIDLRDDARVHDVTVQGNGGAGGVRVSRGGMIERVTAIGNSGFGISSGDNGIITHCRASDQIGATVDGINASNACVITECMSFRNDGRGIEARNQALIVRCNVYHNDGSGIAVLDYSSIIDCMASWSGQDAGVSSHGVVVSDRNLIRGCNAFNNKGSGILSQGTNNRMEDNLFQGNDRYGIEFSQGSPNDVVIRNHANGNTLDQYEVTDTGNIAPIAEASNPTNFLANFK